MSSTVFGILVEDLTCLALLDLICSCPAHCIEPKPIWDRHNGCRIGGRQEDGRFIMRLAFLVALGFGVSVHVGRFQ